jgi:hypothetical protein
MTAANSEQVENVLKPRRPTLPKVQGRQKNIRAGELRFLHRPAGAAQARSRACPRLRAEKTGSSRHSQEQINAPSKRTRAIWSTMQSQCDPFDRAMGG